MRTQLDFNEAFQRAFRSMEETSRNIFITGKAGTGKSTLLRYFRDKTKKNIVVLAPTGVAAVNIQGQTMHSFFHFKPDITPDGVASVRISKKGKAIYRKLKTIVIDEVSMVRADLLDCVDIFLRLHGPKRKKPFGGVQMIFFGDLYQLSPVVTGAERKIFTEVYASPYFFDSKVARELNMELIELEKIYRQRDEHFIGLLNAIRNNSVTDEQMEFLNKKCIPDFQSNGRDLYIHLTTTNDLANQINEEQLKILKTPSSLYEGNVTGEFNLKNLPTQATIEFKAGAQVMLLNNDRQGRWINGSIGKIVSIQKKRGEIDIIHVELSDGQKVEVEPYTWDMFRFLYNEETASIDVESTGSFTQYPLRLAWAVTIHKSQGKTFSKVVIDIGRGTFSHGQVYVALSRCTSLEGIILKKPIHKKHIFMDWRIVRFMTTYQYQQAEKSCSLEEKTKIFRSAIQSKEPVEFVYLRNNDEKSHRRILPEEVGEMEYLDKKYMGVMGYCFTRQEKRIFRLDRILEIKCQESRKNKKDV